ncbi:unnamed protein product [Rotaria socialis]|uniref:Uncharacterized protein n=1 Tax=Rotaria socialis TaxID=392032 RepID=A0A821APE9_9BILA|nr:unnamed protein product [Rotaria socialis]
MPSPATHYRRRSVLLSQNIGKSSNLKFQSSKKNTCTTTHNEQSLIKQNGFNRRSEPTLRDIAVTAMIFKIRRLQNNQDINSICKLLDSLSVKNVPKNMKSIQKQLHKDFDLKDLSKCYYVCGACGTSNLDHIVKCKLCNDTSIFKFYSCSMKQQIQQMLSIFGIFTKLKEEKLQNIHLFSSTKYGEILQEIEENAFTLMVNFDGVCTPNKNLSLWPFVFCFNELPIPDRRYLENIIIAGIIPAAKKPTNVVTKTCLDIICAELMQLELGQEFYIRDIDERKVLHFYSIASCTDQPAAALLENVVPYNAEYGCPKCFHTGELYHGQRKAGANEIKFTIRVYPFIDYQLRTQERSLQAIQKLIDSSVQDQDTALNRSNKQVKSKTKKKKKKKEKKISSYGHLGYCPLTKLKYFKYGTSLLTDSLHTIYGGAFKQLLNLLFDSRYRQKTWSLFKKIPQIDDLLAVVQIPSTTQRRFRSLKHISKYKGSEFRCLFHFGLTTIVQCTHDNSLKNLLLAFLTAINLASAKYVTNESIEVVSILLHYFVKQFQLIFGLRHMSSNIHSVLHVHESLKFMGPLWFYSTFSFEGIDKDLISTVHGTTEFAKQLIRQHILYRDAIIQHNNDRFPRVLFTFNEHLMNRKQTKIHYKNFADSCYLPYPVSETLYDISPNGIATNVRSFFKEDITFYHSITVSGVLLKTTVMTLGKLVSDSCITFQFADDQIRYGLIRAIIKSKKNVVRLFIEELIKKKAEESNFNFKINDVQYHVPNIHRLRRSNIFHLKHPKWILTKNAVICKPSNQIIVLEYPNLKDGS